MKLTSSCGFGARDETDIEEILEGWSWRRIFFEAIAVVFVGK